METTMNVKIESMKAVVSNRGDVNSTYTFEGIVNVKVDSNANVESGSVFGNDGAWLGSFSESDGGQLNITYETKEDRAAILAEIETFVETAKAFAVANLKNV